MSIRSPSLLPPPALPAFVVGVGIATYTRPEMRPASPVGAPKIVHATPLTAASYQ